jgi:Zn-dependent alcohol dehydrogenase
MKPADLLRAIGLVEAGSLELAPLVSERHALTDFEPAFEALATRRGLKTIVEPQRVNGGSGL